MKLKQLTIHNIASIEDAFIDFEAEPLASSEVFLITGKTGAGKSTILDAICLALYANTPRLENTLMQGKMHDKDKELGMNDPVQLMRRNTGEAWTRLAFKGTNGIDYEAIWSVARARGKVTGNIQSKKWSLHNMNTDITYTKDKEIKQEISKAIALDFKQFCRTTMLAQGDFTRFLNSKDDEKAEILEKITGVDIYSKIGAKIFDVTRSKRSAWEDASKLVEDIHVLTEEELIIKRHALNDLEGRAKELKAKAEKIKEICLWIKRENELRQNLTQAEIALKQATKAAENEETQKMAHRVELWDATIEPREWMRERNHAATLVNKQEEELNKLFNLFVLYKEGETVEKEKEQQIKQQIKLLEEQHSSKDLTETVRQAEEHLQRERGALEAFNLPKLRKQNDAIKSLLYQIKVARSSINILQNEQCRRQQMIKGLEETQNGITHKQQEMDMLTPQIHDAEIIRMTLKETYERQRETVSNWAKSIRAKLQIGDICPVCQQPIASILPHEDALEELFLNAENKWKEAEKTYEALTNKRNAIEADQKALSQKYRQDKDNLEKNSLMEEAQQKVSEALKACRINEYAQVFALNELPNDTLQILNTLEQKGLEWEQQISMHIQQAEAKEKKVKMMQASLEVTRKELNKINEQKQLLERQYTAFTTNNQHIATAMDAIEKLMPHWQQLNITTREAHYTATIDLVTKTNELRSQLVSAIDQKNMAKKDFEDKQRCLVGYLHESGLSEEELEQLSAFTQADVTNLRKTIEQKYKNVNDCKVLVKEREQSHANHLANKPKTDMELSMEMLEEQLNELDQQQIILSNDKGGILRDLQIHQENKEKISSLLSEIEAKKNDYERWSKLDQLLGDANGCKFRKIAQSYVLANLIHSANNYMKTLNDRYQLKVEPGTFVISLEDAYQGFASRAASTLSGGECFLVSLALALALSDISQQLSVDTLFIDEGFGTLSGEPLLHAINTLRSLHNKAGRHVGIISHVEELKERIPTQIQVLQESNSSCSTVTVVS